MRTTEETMEAYRVENTQYHDPHRALLGVIAKLMKSPTSTAIIRVADEDAANALKDLIFEAVDRIRFEFDSSERGPNPLWTPGQLSRDKGKIYLVGPYGQTVHPVGFETKR